LESLDAQAQVVQDFVLVLEAISHFIFKLLSKNKEFAEGLPLERLYVLVLFVELPEGLVLETAQTERLVSAFCIDLLLQPVLSIVDLLHYIFLPLDPSFNLRIKPVLQLYNLIMTKVAYLSVFPTSPQS
jgi:hypothetical protein